MTPGIPSNFANAVTPYMPVGRMPVGQEMEELRGSTFKPLEESAQSARGENFRSPDQRPGESDAQWLLRHRSGRDRPSGDRGAGEGQREGRGERRENAADPDTLTLSEPGRAALARERADGAVRESEERREQLETRQEVEQLSRRDREVRMHEQAHAALGGKYAGAPQYEYERGPDGVSYAVSGEVPIDTSPIPNDPEATLDKAQQIRRAAYAPAEPSESDRQVAAEAARMEAQARAEMRREQQIESDRGERAEVDGPAGREDDADEREVTRERAGADADRADEWRRRQIDTYQQLVELGGLGREPRFDQRT